MERSEQSISREKPRFAKLRKGLPEPKNKTQNIVLFNRRVVQQFNVFTDKEIGLTLQFTKHIIRTKEDQDYDSSDEIIEIGTQKCERLLKRKLKQLSKQQQEPENDASETQTDRAYSTEPESRIDSNQ